MNNILAMILSVLVIACFIAAGITISYQNYGLLALSILAGFAVMGTGIFIKRKAAH